MPARATETEKKTEILKAEESGIENEATHRGFRDANRRNRIEEQLDMLHETLRHDVVVCADAQNTIDEQDGPSSMPSKKQSIGKG